MASRRHVLRSLRRDPRQQSGSSLPPATTRRSPGKTAVLGRDPGDGKYIIQISRQRLRRQWRVPVPLAHRQLPAPTAVVPAGGKPGEELDVTFLGDPSGPIKQKDQGAGGRRERSVALHCQTPEGISPTRFKFAIGNLTNTIETGTNVNVATATPGTTPGAFNGVISKPDEVDYFKFTAKRGDLRLPLLRPPSRLPAGPGAVHRQRGRACSSAATLLPRKVPSASPSPPTASTRWDSRPPEEGRPDYFYRIELTPVQPRVETTIPKVDGNNPANQDRQTITVPKGGRTASLLIANRVDFGGPLVMGFDKLPAGVTLTAEQMERG